MRYLLLFFITIILFMFPESLKADEMITVKLVNYIDNRSELNFQFKGEYYTLDPILSLQEGVNYSLTATKNNDLILKGGGKTLRIKESLVLIPSKYDYAHRINVNDRAYLGAMEFLIEDKKFIRPVNQLPLEDYLKGVVPNEVFPSWGLETLKAQTLAARTYAATHTSEIIDDTIRYQVYGGYTWYKNSTKAVEETRGEVITYQNKPINAFYSASNGGITENNAHVWDGKSLPYLPVKKDPYDPIHPWKFNLHAVQIPLNTINWDKPLWWKETVEKNQDITSSMKSWLQRNGYPGDIKILSIPHFELSNKRHESERRIKGSITIQFLHRLAEGTILFEQLVLDDVAIDHIRPLIGGTIFKSYLVDSLEKSEGTYTMKGRGFGHGVGMSQWGAHIMGQRGNSYKEIIQFYYPGTSITDINNE
ncbi:SpoIID/LytB domain-containing protein [Virgibacillus sp. JSM 102003]